ncbi:MAG: 50S ribosomal protein L10 [Candidatus Bipolaricaulota bacterium]|nr:50S ribosomal protein L10 [Candidatus Bipolaricaulota bacterium]MCX7844639.1 50S ribosomal protein L10 [Candidatus Bipolaricaulota bacterium]MDW8151651.1 50S ribosomal protein L10 [Candidatus Bipolaricaulota bacterium]
MVRPEKAQAVAELRAKLSRSRTAVVLGFQGIPGEEMTALRRLVKARGAELKVVKNTLARRAAQEAGIPGLGEFLRGPNLVIIGRDDPTVPFKVATEVVQKYPNYFQVRGGVFAGEVVPADQVQWYATLPSREELLGRLAGAMLGPVRGLAFVLSGVLRKLVVALSEVQKLKEKEG